MSEYVLFGETVEGEASNVCTRNQRWEGPHLHPVTKQRMMLYKFIDNSSVEVTKAGIEPDDQELKDATVMWHRNEGDKIRGYHIACYANTKRKLSFEVKEGISGRHGAQLLSINSHTIAAITVPMPNIQPQIEMNKLLTKK